MWATMADFSYPTFAIEALSRRLADFAFMLRDYKYASSIYDSLRRDFAQDRAWRYAAAATEMYGFSLLLSHTYFLPSSPPNRTATPFTTLQHIDISSWLEQAVLAYHGRAPANQIQLDALRISVLYYEAWKTMGEWRGVGAALVKGAGEADEVPSAVLIEEAAAADIKGGKSERGGRRRAHHLVMAARRYETAGLVRQSSFECLVLRKLTGPESVLQKMPRSCKPGISIDALDCCSRPDRVLSRASGIYAWGERCGSRTLPAAFTSRRYRRSRVAEYDFGRYGSGVRGKPDSLVQ